jgi:hypothetical protein
MRNLLSNVRLGVVVLTCMAAQTFGVGCNQVCEVFPEFCEPGDPACTPKTQEEACGNMVCGEVDNGCGVADIQCGTCEDCGEVCSAGECVYVPENICGEDVCGQIDDNCGNLVDCGSCDGCGMSCDGGQCVYASPNSCSELGVECGEKLDDCDQPMDCGQCEGCGMECNNDYQCEYVSSDTCEGLCGETVDQCGNPIDCGGCDGCGETCQDAQCAYTPVYNCLSLGLECGVAEDECGNNMECGTCGDGQYCSDVFKCEEVAYSCYYYNPVAFKASDGQIKLWMCHEYSESWGGDVAAMEEQCNDFKVHVLYPFPDPPGTNFSQAPCNTHVDLDKINGQCYVAEYNIMVWGEQLVQDDDEDCDIEVDYSSAWACAFLEGEFTCDH